MFSSFTSKIATTLKKENYIYSFGCSKEKEKQAVLAEVVQEILIIIISSASAERLYSSSIGNSPYLRARFTKKYHLLFKIVQWFQETKRWQSIRWKSIQWNRIGKMILNLMQQFFYLKNAQTGWYSVRGVSWSKHGLVHHMNDFGTTHTSTLLHPGTVCQKMKEIIHQKQ